MIDSSLQPIPSDLDHMLVDASIDRLMAIDNNWNIISWNKTSELILGIPAKDLIGRNLLEAFPEFRTDEALLKAFDVALKGYKSFLPADKSIRHRQLCENHYIPLRGEGNEVIGVMNIMHDVGHRIKAEQQLQQLNSSLEKKFQELERASAELSTYTFITSTSIKEPVKHLYTGLEFLLKSEGKNLSDTGKASLRRMQSSLNRMNLLVNDILNFSQINDHGRTQVPVEPDEVMKAAIGKLEERIRETGAVINLPHSWPRLTGHPELIELLFFHLLDNALKFCPVGKNPVLDVRVETNSRPDGAAPGTTYTKISFCDQGIGFDPVDASKIFVLFEKLNGKDYRGSGMGLAIARKILGIHDGLINAEGRPGKGADIHVWFPGIAGE